MYSFPVAAVTNYHALNGWKQQKVIFSQFWKQKVRISISDVSKATLPLDSLREIWFFACSSL